MAIPNRVEAEHHDLAAIRPQRAYERSKQDPVVHEFVRYLVNWVAGTKLIFLLLLLVIVFTADTDTLLFTGVAMAVAVASFFWRLFPLVRRMDADDQLEPSGYSKLLGVMIAAMVLTGIVVAVCATGLALTLAVRHREEEDERSGTSPP